MSASRRSLDTREEAGVPGTFFAPGWTAEHHTGWVEMIVRAGHEIGPHSYSHRWAGDSPEKEIVEVEGGLEALRHTVGVVPKGYRSPAGEVGEYLFHVLNEHGFLYDSSLLDHADRYRHTMPDGSKGPIELPWHGSLDDVPFALFSVKNPRPIFTNERILKVFEDEVREIYCWGGLFDLTMHPQVTGRPSRIALLREMIAFIRTFPGVWFATGAPGSRGVVVPKRAGLSVVRARWATVHCFLSQGGNCFDDKPTGASPPCRLLARLGIGEDDTVGNAPNQRSY
jgi:peptidoglycan-N-acetylglucosamine deacetylase